MRLSPATVALLLLPPLCWAGNVVLGRFAAELIPPMALNLLRWTGAGLLLAPLAWRSLRVDGPVWPHWRRLSVLGLLGVGCYNSLQYLALHTSTALNVTLVAASMPLWTLVLGTLFFGERSRPLQWVGAALSMTGVLTVLSRGHLDTLLQVKLVPGDLWVLLATILWATYSWMIARPKEPAALRGDWAAFLLAQIVFGLGWSALFTVGEQWAGAPPIHWGAATWAVLAYVAIFPSVVAFRAWSAGIARTGPAVAAFFQNLTPLFTALLSLALLGEAPSTYHALAFALLAGGIWVSSRPARVAAR